MKSADSKISGADPKLEENAITLERLKKSLGDEKTLEKIELDLLSEMKNGR